MKTVDSIIKVAYGCDGENPCSHGINLPHHPKGLSTKNFWSDYWNWVEFLRQVLK